MKPTLLLLLTALYFTVQASSVILAQENFNYETSKENPYGLPNPGMPDKFKDLAPLIGECNCKSISRIDKDTWSDTVSMTWTFKYIMNGMAVQDDILKEDGKHAGSIRQYNSDSSRWNAHYFSAQPPTTELRVWEGNKTDNGNIIFSGHQKASDGAEGIYKMTFSEISDKGFNWLGEWLPKDESFSFQTLKVFCIKVKNI